MNWKYGFPVFDLRTMYSLCGTEVSIYRNVLVIWDEDRDARVLSWIDDQPPEVIDKLILVAEHEGGISFLWNGCIPHGYEQSEMAWPPDEDAWSINESRVNRDPRYKYEA
jgi:hypothetical protein